MFDKNKRSSEGTFWYVPIDGMRPGDMRPRTPADLAEEASLLESEDFFTITGMAMGQLPMPDGTYRRPWGEAPPEQDNESLWVSLD